MERRGGDFDVEPLELLKDWTDVVTGAGVGEQTGNRGSDVVELQSPMFCDTTTLMMTSSVVSQGGC